MKTALICGVSGQDGCYLAKFLLSKGYSVTGTSRDVQSNAFLGLKYLGIKENIDLVSMSLMNFRSIIDVIEYCNPDEIYNLAGQSSVSMSFDFPIETIESINDCIKIAIGPTGKNGIVSNEKDHVVKCFLIKSHHMKEGKSFFYKPQRLTKIKDTG